MQTCLELEQTLNLIASANQGIQALSTTLTQMALIAEASVALCRHRTYTSNCRLDQAGQRPDARLAANRREDGDAREISVHLARVVSTHRLWMGQLAAAETHARDSLHTALADVTMATVRYLEARDQP